MSEVTDLGRDAAILIMELNKGLSSANLGEQCKTIAEFPILFEKYPFPMVINSIFLKISELFREGSNYLRLGILRACTECRGQLDKLTVSDDIVRKLLPLTGSNDPAARALSIRLFGVLSRIVKNNISVHHIVISKLESHYEVELNAAIWTAYELASLSRIFALSLCPVICNLLQVLTTDTDTKLKLISLGEYAYHDIAFLPKMRNCLIDLAQSFRVSTFVMKIFNTLTNLEVHAPIHTVEQIELILQFLQQETAPDVKASLLSNLSRFASCLSNHWNQSHILKLCDIFNASSSSVYNKEAILMIFYQLTWSCNVADLLISTIHKEKKQSVKSTVAACICQSALAPIDGTGNSSNLVLPALALACRLCVLDDLRVDESLNTPDEILRPDAVAGFLVSALSSPSSSWFLASDGPSIPSLKLLFTELLQFFKTFPHLQSVIGVVGFFKQVSLSTNPRIALLCQFLGHLCEQQSTADALQATWLPNLSEIFDQFENATSTGSSNVKNAALLQACILVFRLARGRPLSDIYRSSLLASLARVTSNGMKDSEKFLDPWLIYQFACRASLHKQPLLAADLFAQLSDMTITHRNLHWLQGLATFNRAEANLLSAVANISSPPPPPASSSSDESYRPAWIPCLAAALQKASTETIEAARLVKSARGHEMHWFQTAYIDIRASFFECLAQICIQAFHTTSHAAKGGRCARWNRIRMEKQIDNVKLEPPIVSQSPRNPFAMLKSLLPEWKLLDEKILALYQRCLDADLQTLCHLKTFSDIVQLFITSIAKVSGSGTVSASPCLMPSSTNSEATTNDNSSVNGSVDSESLRSVLHTLSDFLQSNPLIHSGRLLISLVSLLISTSLPFCLPNLFFTRCQSTSVRLVLLPSGTGTSAGSGTSGDEGGLTVSSTPNVIMARHETGLVLQVMGVVSQRKTASTNSQSGLIRPVTATDLVLSISQDKQEKRVPPTLGSVIETQRRVVPIQRDYFHAEFCVALPSAAIVSGGNVCRLRLEAFLLDANGARWRLDNSGLVTQTLQVHFEGGQECRRPLTSQQITMTGEADFSRPILNSV